MKTTSNKLLHEQSIFFFNDSICCSVLDKNGVIMQCDLRGLSQDTYKEDILKVPSLVIHTGYEFADKIHNLRYKTL